LNDTYYKCIKYLKPKKYKLQNIQYLILKLFTLYKITKKIRFKTLFFQGKLTFITE